MCVVARRVLEMGLEAPVVVATDDQRVAEAVRGLPVEAVLTDPAHESGTDRVAEVARTPRFKADIVLNVQGDEPFLPAEAAKGAIARVEAGDPVGTAGAWLAPEAVSDTERVKVAVDEHGRALRFSRTYPRSRDWGPGVEVIQHVGVYAYTAAALGGWVSLPALDAERTERLEQLRPLVAGWTVGVARLGAPAPVSIDTTEDLTRAEALLAVTR